MNRDLPVTSEPPRRSGQLAGAVAIVASAGGIPALMSLLSSLPNTFPLPIFVAQHLTRGPSALDGILGRHTALSVGWAVHGEEARRGHVYVVPPGMRLSVTAAGLEVSQLAPPASSWLAAADHLVTSVAGLYGAHSIGIVLSGMVATGMTGLRAIKACGGFAIAQDRTSSEYFEMPAAAIDFAKAEIVMPPQRIADVLKIIAQCWQAESASSDQTDRSAGAA
jgi:two-component system chemotaxis response regulator CheB